MTKIARRLERELPPKRGERVVTRAEVLDACAYDRTAIRLIESSSFTTHHRVGLHRHVRVGNVINDFFEPGDFRGRRILELGPGHYSFAMVARHLGATVVCVERYAPHVALGRHLGFEVLDADFRDLTTAMLGGPVDGLWMKGAFNACSFPDEEAIDEFVRRLTGLLTPEGWGWSVTVNKSGAEEPDASFVDDRIDAQRLAFKHSGWALTPIDEADRKRYAVSYAGARYYFTRRLPLAIVGRAERAQRVPKSTPEPRRGPRLLTRDEALDAAGLDEAAIAIACRSSNSYGAGRCVKTANIVNDFFDREHFDGRRILELGPGQYAFALLARRLGAEVVCVDKNPDIVALGRHLGFRIVDASFLDPDLETDLDDLGAPFDGLWMKGAFSATCRSDAAGIDEFVRRLTSWISPGGWGWCVPNNRPRDAEPGTATRALIDAQHESFRRHGWDTPPIRDDDRDRYALKMPYYGGSRTYFTRSLPLAPA